MKTVNISVSVLAISVLSILLVAPAGAQELTPAQLEELQRRDRNGEDLGKYADEFRQWQEDQPQERQAQERQVGQREAQERQAGQREAQERNLQQNVQNVQNERYFGNFEAEGFGNMVEFEGSALEEGAWNVGADVTMDEVNHFVQMNSNGGRGTIKADLVGEFDLQRSDDFEENFQRLSGDFDARITGTSNSENGYMGGFSETTYSPEEGLDHTTSVGAGATSPGSVEVDVQQNFEVNRQQFGDRN